MSPNCKDDPPKEQSGRNLKRSILDNDDPQESNTNKRWKVSQDIPKSPTPPPRSPPRARKRPGGTSRLLKPSTASHTTDTTVVDAEKTTKLSPSATHQPTSNGLNPKSDNLVQHITNHYNSVRQRGRVWRQVSSLIRGLRAYNNWIKFCVIRKFGRSENSSGLKILDIGCGKGGDLGKWSSSPHKVDLYVGLDPADVSISQARQRYLEMARKSRSIFQAVFHVQDCFAHSIGSIPIIHETGFDTSMNSRFSKSGFDVVSMMFSMHYAFETREKALTMLQNVAASLRKGGRFIGVIPNSDVISQNCLKHTEWGNSIYSVKLLDRSPPDGVFRPPFGWKYQYFLEEAIDQVPEFVVPWEAFRGMAEEFNLELEYRKTFCEIWLEENSSESLGSLANRMHVRDPKSGKILLTPEELEAAHFYHAFCFYKV